MKKSKPAHRPAGSPNIKNQYARDQIARSFRCSQGFNKVVEMLVASGLYNSKADVYHEAVQRLAFGKDIEIEHYNLWRGKIQ